MIQYPDLFPTSSSNAKVDHVKSFPIYRADLVASLAYTASITATTIPSAQGNFARAVLPAAATPLAMTIWSQTGSDAGTTAAINIGAVMPYVQISAAGPTATVTFALPHQLTTADLITVSGCATANFNVSNVAV